MGKKTMLSEREKRAMKHPDKLGAGAKKRQSLTAMEKTHVVMAEYERGTLHSGSGEKVTDPKQAYAIAMSEARKQKGGARSGVGRLEKHKNKS